MSKVLSKTTQREYDDDKVLYFYNAKQSACYVLWGATLLDVIPNEENKRFLFVFSVEDHRKYRNKWNETRPQEKINE